MSIKNVTVLRSHITHAQRYFIPKGNFGSYIIIDNFVPLSIEVKKVKQGGKCRRDLLKIEIQLVVT